MITSYVEQVEQMVEEDLTPTADSVLGEVLTRSFTVALPTCGFAFLIFLLFKKRRKKN